MRSGISFEVHLLQAPTPAKSARGRPPAKNGKADDDDDEEEDEEDDGDDDDGSDFDPGSEEETKKKKVNFLTKTLLMDGHKMIRIHPVTGPFTGQERSWQASCERKGQTRNCGRR